MVPFLVPIGAFMWGTLVPTIAQVGIGQPVCMPPLPPDLPATVKATAEAHAQPPLALPRPSEFGGVGHSHTLPLPPHPPRDITAMPPARLEHPDTTHPSTSSKRPRTPPDTHPSASTSGAPASPPRKKATPPMGKALAKLAETATMPPPLPSPPTPPELTGFILEESDVAGLAVAEASLYLLPHVFPTAS